jgi:hypothetical protein
MLLPAAAAAAAAAASVCTPGTLGLSALPNRDSSSSQQQVRCTRALHPPQYRGTLAPPTPNTEAHCPPQYRGTLAMGILAMALLFACRVLDAGMLA